jgi:hypothetical protein
MANSALRWFKAAIVLQILLLAYWLAIEVVELNPWNDLAARGADYDLRASIMLNALPQLAFMALFGLGIRPAATLSALGYGVYLAAQLWFWWRPVVWAADAEWPRHYGELYARTIKVPYSEGLALAPDAQHLALQALTFLTLFVTAMAASRMRYL